MNSVDVAARGDLHWDKRVHHPMPAMGRDVSVPRFMVEEARQSAALQERKRLAREIHDTLAQTLTAILVHVRAADDMLADQPGEAQAHLALVKELTQEGLAEVRRTVQALRPQTLETGDLSSALQRSVTRITDGTKLDVRFQERGTRYPLPPEAEDELLRIGQEALTNVVRHAQAQHVQVELVFEPGMVTLRVRDDGRGFAVGAAKQGFGLLGMRERADRLGAILTVHSVPGQSAEVKVVLPSARKTLR